MTFSVPQIFYWFAVSVSLRPIDVQVAVPLLRHSTPIMYAVQTTRYPTEFHCSTQVIPCIFCHVFANTFNNWNISVIYFAASRSQRTCPHVTRTDVALL